MLSEALPGPVLPGLPHLMAPRHFSLGRLIQYLILEVLHDLCVTGNYSDVPVTCLNASVRGLLLVLPGQPAGSSERRVWRSVRRRGLGPL